MIVSSVGNGVVAGSERQNANGRSLHSRFQHLAFLRMLVGLAIFVAGAVGCSERTKIEPAVGVAEQALNASEWPAQALVVSNSIHLDQRAQVTGDVAARVASPGPVLYQNAELGLANDARINGNARADTIYLGNTASTISGTGGYNSRSVTGTIVGAVQTPLSLPLAITMPTMPTVSPGTTVITVNANTTVTKAAGAYAAVTVNGGNGGGTSKLILSGGTYHFASIEVQPHARLECSADCEIRVNGRVAIGSNSFIGASGAGLAPSNMRLVVKGANSSPFFALNVEPDSRIEAFVFAPNGTTKFNARVVARGKVVGKDVYYGVDANGAGIDPPIITQHPVSQTVIPGQSVTFTVVATGAALTYQWQRNGVNIAGATSAGRTFNAVAGDNNAQYRVIVSNLGGSITSNAATLTVVSCVANDTVCNGIDDDCNGTVDEDYVPTCGTGSGNPRLICSGGAVVPVACSDNNVCNGVEACGASTGGCVAGTAPVVSDGNNCTVDSCDPVTGVHHTASTEVGCPGGGCANDLDCVPGEVCEYGPSCSGTKSCVAGCRDDGDCAMDDHCVVDECQSCPCAGVCESDPIDPGSSTKVLFTIYYPVGRTRETTLFSAEEYLRVAERVTVSTPYKHTAVASFGPQGVYFGAAVHAFSDIYAHGPVTLQSQTEVNGFVRTEGEPVTKQDNSVKVRGEVRTLVPVPYQTYSWEVGVPNTFEHVDILNTGVVELEPGAYDQLYANGGEFRLRSGVYHFGDWVTQSGTSVKADTTNGPVIIYIHDEWTYRGGLTTVGGQPGADVLVGWLGAGVAPLEAPFVGTAVGPNGKLELRRPTSGQHKGGFFGREIEVYSDCPVEPIPFPWPLLPGGPKDTDGDGVPDDIDGCPLNPLKIAWGVCGCSSLDVDDDGDKTPNCIDQCPDDPNNTIFGTCGCRETGVLAPTGTACVPEALSGRGAIAGTCDGTGRCIGPAGTDDGSPVVPPGGGGGDEGTCFDTEYEDHYYWVCSGPATWQAAHEACIAESGRQLVRVDDIDEDKWLREQIGVPSWIGANDANTDGAWFWASPALVDGRPFWNGETDGTPVNEAFTYWSNGAPVDGACAALAFGGNWLAESCTATRGFICEQPKRYYPVYDPKFPCEIFPGAVCDPNDPGGGGEDPPTGGPPGSGPDTCLEPAAAGLPADEAQAVADWEKCANANPANGPTCAYDGDPGCATACTGWAAVPPTNSSCEAFNAEVSSLCEVDTDQAFRLVRSCSECTGSEQCGTAYECGVPDALGNLPLCGGDSDCPAGQACASSAPYCVQPGRPCEEDATGRCTDRCFASPACGHLHPNCAANEDLSVLEPCSETWVCSPNTVVSTTVVPLDTPGLTPTQFNPDDYFEPPAPPAEITYESSKPADCGGVGEPACGDVYATGEHPWCHYAAREGDTSRPGTIDVSDADMGDKGGGGSSGILTFDFDPNLDLQYDLSGFNPFAFNLDEATNLTSSLASASASAVAKAHLDLLGIQTDVKILDAEAQVGADRCGLQGHAHLKLFGLDLLPIVLCGDPLKELENFASNSDFRADCLDALQETQTLLNRAKKALRDAQELVRQYKALADQGLRFSPDLCEQLLDAVEVMPEGFGKLPDGSDFTACDLVTPEQVLGMYINYYRYEVEKLVRHQEDTLAGKLEGALPEFTVSIPFNQNGGVTLSKKVDGQIETFVPKEHTTPVTASWCDDEDASQTQQLANITFALGPIPMNLTLDAFLSYGIGGSLDFKLDGSAVAKVLLPEVGQPTQKHELVGARVSVTPWAKAGVELFVGAGFDFGIAAAKIGISGNLVLGDVKLPVYGGASLDLVAEVDTRPPPSDFLGIMPSYTLLFPKALPQRISVSAGYKFGIDVEVKDILYGTIDAKARIKFLFFSKTWAVRILEFGPAIEMPLRHLVYLEGGTTLAEADTSALAKFQIPVPFPDFGEILGIPLPPYNPREFDGVRSLQSLEDADVDPNDPRYVQFDKSRVGELMYDGYCEPPLPTCAETGEECGGEGFGCCGENMCVGTAYLGVPATCKACAEHGNTCNTAADCCNNGYQTMLCYPDSEATLDYLDVCQSCRTAGSAASLGADANSDGVVDGGCCQGLLYNEFIPGAAANCIVCAAAGDNCGPGGTCCGGHLCNSATNKCVEGCVGDYLACGADNECCSGDCGQAGTCVPKVYVPKVH